MSTIKAARTFLLTYVLLIWKCAALNVGTHLISSPRVSASKLELQNGSDRAYVGIADYPTKYLIIGATGRVGSRVVSKLISAGYDVKCLVRDQTRASAMGELKGAVFHEGSTDDIESLVNATRDCDVVVDVHGMKPPRFSKLTDLVLHPKHDNTHPYNVNYLGTKRVLAAMKINNVRKLVRITGSLTGKPAFLFPIVLFNFLLSMSPKWHERSEIAIRESGVEYTVLRPTEIVEEPPALVTGRSLLVLQGDAGERPPLPGKVSVVDLSDLVFRAAKSFSLFSRTSVVVSSIDGTDGSQSWDPLCGKVVKDYVKLVPQKHSLATSLFAGVILPSIIFVATKFIKLALRLIAQIISRR